MLRINMPGEVPGTEAPRRDIAAPFQRDETGHSPRNVETNFTPRPEEHYDYTNFQFPKLDSPDKITMQRYCGPTPESNWVIPGKLLVGAYPASQDDSETFSLLTNVLRLGVTKFVCLQQEYTAGVAEEVWRSGRALRPYFEDVILLVRNKHMFNVLNGPHIVTEDRLSFDHFPIKDCSVTDDARVLNLARHLVTALAKNEVIYLHCWGGHGRTGTVVCLMLHLMYGYDAATCMQHCQLAHDKRQCPVNVGSPQTKTQCDQVIRLISYLQATYKNNVQALKQEENKRNRNTKYRRRSEGATQAEVTPTESRRRQSRKAPTPTAGRVAGPPISSVANRRPQRRVENDTQKERIATMPSTDSTDELSAEPPQRKASGADTETSIASDSMMNEVDEAVFQMLSSDSEDEKETPVDCPHMAMPMINTPTLHTVTPTLASPSSTPPADEKSSVPHVLLPPVTVTPPDNSSPNTPTSMDLEGPPIQAASSSHSLSLSPSPPPTKSLENPSPRDMEPRISDVGPLVSRSPEPKPPPLKFGSRSWKGGLKSLRNVFAGSNDNSPAANADAANTPERNMFRRWSFSNPLRRHKDEKFETVLPS